MFTSKIWGRFPFWLSYDFKWGWNQQLDGNSEAVDLGIAFFCWADSKGHEPFWLKGCIYHTCKKQQQWKPRFRILWIHLTSYHSCWFFDISSLKLTACPWEWMVGRLAAHFFRFSACIVLRVFLLLSTMVNHVYINYQHFGKRQHVIFQSF